MKPTTMSLHHSLPKNKANKKLKENCQLVIQSVMQCWGPDEGIANRPLESGNYIQHKRK